MENKVSVAIELKKAGMAFKLKDGKVLLIDRDDVQEIANKIIVEAMVNDGKCVYMIHDFNLKKSESLYQVYQKERQSMTDELKNNYLKAILELGQSQDFGIKSMKEHFEETKKENK